MDPHLPADYVPPGGTRRQGVTTRSTSNAQDQAGSNQAAGAQGTVDPPPVLLPDPRQADEDPFDDPLLFPADTASATLPTPAATAGDAGRIAAYEAAHARVEQALLDEQTNVAEMSRRLQQQQDLILQLQQSSSIYKSASGSKKKSRADKKDKTKSRKEPTPSPVKKQQDKAELLAGLQALLQVYDESPAQALTGRGRHARKGPRRGRRDEAPLSPRSSTTTSRSTSKSRASSSDSSSGPPTPPSPPSSPSENSDGSMTEEEEAIRPRRRRHYRRRAEEDREVYDRRLAVQAPNRRYRRLLSYKTYFLEDTRLAYPPRLVKKAYKLNKCLNGPFQGQAPFNGKDPLGIFGFLSTFKRACDAAGASHGQALPLLSFRLEGQAKLSFVSARSSQAKNDRHAIRTYGDGVNWLLQKYATPDKLNEAYSDIISAHQEQEEAPRSFGERLERMCDRLDGLFNSGDIVDTFVNGLNDAVKAHVLTFQMTKGRVSLPEAITAAQIYWTGIQKMKVDLRRHIRNTTTPIRVATVPDAVGVAAAVVTPPLPPRFARVERDTPAVPRPRSPSPRRAAAPTDECYNCHNFGHFLAECPEPRRPRRQDRDAGRVNAVVDAMVDEQVNPQEQNQEN